MNGGMEIERGNKEPVRKKTNSRNKIIVKYSTSLRALHSKRKEKNKSLTVKKRVGVLCGVVVREMRSKANNLEGRLCLCFIC